MTAFHHAVVEMGVSMTIHRRIVILSSLGQFAAVAVAYHEWRRPTFAQNSSKLPYAGGSCIKVPIALNHGSIEFGIEPAKKPE